MEGEGGQREGRQGAQGGAAQQNSVTSPSALDRGRHHTLVLPSGQADTGRGRRTCEDCGFKEEAARQRVSRLKLRAAAAAGRHRALGQRILHLGLHLGGGQIESTQELSCRRQTSTLAAGCATSRHTPARVSSGASLQPQRRNPPCPLQQR